MEHANPNPHLLFAEEREVVASIMISSSVIFMFFNLYIIKTIVFDKSLYNSASYKFMIVLCLFDISQLIVHFITGILTVFQTIGHPLLVKTLGVIATPSYICYVLTTVILAFNRFVHLAVPKLDQALFSAKAIKLWTIGTIFCGFCFSVALASPYATIQYDVDRFAWFYDTKLPASYMVEQIEMIVEIGGIFVFAGIYLLIVCFLCIWFSKSSFPFQDKVSVEVKLLVQSFLLASYCTALNWLWHKYPKTDLSCVALNLMWIFNGGLNPVIYLVINPTVRKTSRITISIIFAAQKKNQVIPTAAERKQEFKETLARTTGKKVFVT